MTITCRQHLPAYFDPVNIERKTWTFATAAEMLASEHFACWRDDPSFHAFVISGRHDEYRKAHEPLHLMVEQDGGDKWWVIGYLTADNWTELDEIPDWKEPP